MDVVVDGVYTRLFCFHPSLFLRGKSNAPRYIKLDCPLLSHPFPFSVVLYSFNKILNFVSEVTTLPPNWMEYKDICGTRGYLIYSKGVILILLEGFSCITIK